MRTNRTDVSVFRQQVFLSIQLLDCCLITIFAQMSHYKHFLRKSVAKTKKEAKNKSSQKKTHRRNESNQCECLQTTYFSKGLLVVVLLPFAQMRPLNTVVAKRKKQKTKKEAKES